MNAIIFPYPFLHRDIKEILLKYFSSWTLSGVGHICLYKTNYNLEKDVEVIN